MVPCFGSLSCEESLKKIDCFPLQESNGPHTQQEYLKALPKLIQREHETGGKVIIIVTLE